MLSLANNHLLRLMLRRIQPQKRLESSVYFGTERKRTELIQCISVSWLIHADMFMSGLLEQLIPQLPWTKAENTKKS